jgi:branched-chain amino acid transport system substrate-binding protein
MPRMPERPAVHAHRATRLLAALGVVAALAAAPARAQEVKIGVVATLSGPAASLGQQLRDGFALGVDQAGGKLGGLPTSITVIDDELKPDVAVTKVRGLLEGEKADFIVGPIFSNILLAIFKPVTESGAILISPNAGPSTYAGRACNANFFVTSYQNDQPHAVSGKFAQDSGYKRVYLIAPNSRASSRARSSRNPTCR